MTAAVETVIYPVTDLGEPTRSTAVYTAASSR